MLKTFFVINPKSAAGQTGKRWLEMQAQATRALGTFDHAFTQKQLDAVRLTQAALREGYQCVVAVGGDGTINEVANGFFGEDGKVIAPQAALGVIPRGTGGDFRRSFDWDLTLASAFKRLGTDDTAPLDVGRLEFTTHDGGSAVRYFVNVCSFGVSGEVADEANKSSKVLGGTASFFMASLKTLLRYSDRKVRIAIDGGPKREMTITTAAVANGRFFGGGMKVAPNASPSDGLFDITLWRGYGLTDFVFKSQGVYSGSHVKWSGTECLQGKELVAESDERVLIDCDGEQPGRLPCKMTMLPGAIRVKV